jgi:hypothetical protein
MSYYYNYNKPDILLMEDELSHGDLQWLAEISMAPVRVSYSLDIYVTCDGFTVMADDMYGCENCGQEERAADLLTDDEECESDETLFHHVWINRRKLTKYDTRELNRDDWHEQASDQFIPYPLNKVFDDVDVSDPDVDDWCGEYITQTVSADIVFDDADRMEWLERFYSDWGGIWDKYPITLCDTMGILSADGIWPAKAVESIEEGWADMSGDPAFAGSLYISDPRLFVQIGEAS